MIQIRRVLGILEDGVIQTEQFRVQVEVVLRDVVRRRDLVGLTRLAPELLVYERWTFDTLVRTADVGIRRQSSFEVASSVGANMLGLA